MKLYEISGCKCDLKLGTQLPADFLAKPYQKVSREVLYQPSPAYISLLSIADDIKDVAELDRILKSMSSFPQLW